MVALVDISAGMFLGEYRTVFKKLAETKQVIICPSVLNKLITNPAMKSDFFHPNARDTKLWLVESYKAIARYIK